MTRPVPTVRTAGSAGPPVVCLHANASSGSQWRDLMERLAPRFCVFAPDAYDVGDGPKWPSDRVITLADEVALIEPILAAAGPGLVLVGHSYGAAVALIAAVRQPERVRALALYEPTLFSLISAQSPASDEADGIRHTVAAAAEALDAGDADAAAQRFIDYWMGQDSWQRMPQPRRAPIAASVRNVRRWWHALAAEPTPLAALRTLDVPVLLMTGGGSTPAALGVARRLQTVLPRVERVSFDALGHMGPITHAATVNAAIEGFLDRL